LLVVVAACAAGVVPFACGGAAFQTGSADGGETMDASIEGATGDSMSSGDSTPDGLGPVDSPLDGVGPIDAPQGDGAPPPVEAGTIINGVVVDKYGVPMAGVGVHAQLQVTTTASNGTFSLSGLAVPYDLNLVVGPTAAQKHGYVFKGVTRKDPTLQLVADQAAIAETATITGMLPTNALDSAGIVFADLPPGTPAAASNTIAVGVGAVSYSGDVSWFGGPTVSATLYVLQTLVVNGAPDGFIAYASTTMPLSGGAASVWDPPPSSSLGNATLTLGLGVSAGYAPAEAAVYLRPPGAQIAALLAHDVKNVTSSETFTTPVIPQATFVACGVQVPNGSDAGTNGAFGAACTSGLGGDASPTVTLPQATSFVSPPASAGIGTTFTFQALPGGVSFVAFGPPGASTTGDSLYVITTASDVTIPDFSLLGVVVPPGQTYVAETYGFAPFATVDSATGPTGFDAYLVDLALEQGPVLTGQVAHGNPVTFTTQ
jgi:hypothetical protein